MKNVIAYDGQRKVSRSSSFVFLLLLLICTGCPPPPNCAKGELNFEPPTFAPLTVYSTRGSFFNNGTGLYAGLTDFSYSSGSTELQHASIDSIPPYPFGSGQVLRLNVASLSFDLTAGTKSVKFDYLYLRGTINIGVKGNTNVYIGSLENMPDPHMINGVKIWRTNVHDILNPQGARIGETGEINLEHPTDVGGLIIGGMELYVDNFCTN